MAAARAHQQTVPPIPILNDGAAPPPDAMHQPHSRPELAITREHRARVGGLLQRMFIAAMLALGAIAASVIVLLAMRRADRRSVTRGRDVGRIAREAMLLAVDRETSVRGFLLSHDRRALGPAIDAAAALPATLDSLVALTADDPPQHARALAVRAAAARWDSAFARPVIASGAAPADGALAGAALFDRVRAANDAFLAAEDASYARRAARERLVDDLGGALLLIEVAIIGVALVGLRRRLRRQGAVLAEQQDRLARSYDELEDQYAQLGEQAAELETQASELQDQALELETANHELRARTREAESARSDASTSAAALRESVGLVRALVDHAPHSIVALDVRGAVLEWNPAAERLFGWSAAELRGGQSPLRFTEADGSALDVRALLRRAGSIVGRECHANRRDGGSLAIALSAASLSDDSGATDGIVLLAEDLTQRASLEAQLRQAQKMEAVGRLAGGVAHDFNNVLAVITSYSALLAEDLGADDPRREEVDEIRRAAERAAALTRQLLVFSRQQATSPRILDVNAVIGDTEKMLRRVIGVDVELETHLAPDLGFIHVDPVHLEQVLMNLAVNARDAMPAGGTLSISTANSVTAPDWTPRGAAADVPPTGFVKIEVADTGSGMSAEVQAQIFEPFFTTKAPGLGTGLGLSTVYGIVRQARGHIRVVSEVDRGTTFEIYLPRTAIA